MKSQKKTFINPFSDEFLQHWQTWKDFKKEEFNFEYRGVTSEQMAIKHLVDLSDGDEEKAVKILCQSVRRRWQGFWPLHETTNGTKNGKSTPKAEQPNLQQSVASQFNGHYGTGEEGQPTDRSHLKAI